MPSDARQSTAVHESGHATIASALGVPLFAVELFGHGGGRCVFDAEQLAALEPLERCAIFAAGAIAQRVVLAETAQHGENFPDATQMRWATENVSPPAWADYTRQLGVDKARELVGQHQAAITALANELLQRGRLTGAEVEATLSRFGVG